MDSNSGTRSGSVSISSFNFTKGKDIYRCDTTLSNRSSHSLGTEKRMDLFANKLCFRYFLVLAAEWGAPNWDHCALLLFFFFFAFSWLVIHSSANRNQISIVAALQWNNCLATHCRKSCSTLFVDFIPINFDPQNWREFFVSNKSPSIWQNKESLLIMCIFNLATFFFSKIVLCSTPMLLFDCRNGRAFFVISLECLYSECLYFKCIQRLTLPVVFSKFRRLAFCFGRDLYCHQRSLDKHGV